MKNGLKRIGVTEILGKEIEFYGSWEEPYFLGKKVVEWIIELLKENKLI